MNDEEQARLDAAIRDLWKALSDVDPADRVWLLTVFTVGVIVGIAEGLGLLAPFYGVLLVAVGGLLLWAIRLLARSKL